MHRVTAGLVGVGLAAGMFGCGGNSAKHREPEPEVVVSKLPQGPACRSAAGERVLSTFAGPVCPWVLRREQQVLVLTSLDPQAQSSSRGQVPSGCEDRACGFSGYFSPGLGPLLLVEQPHPDSEMPSAVHLGYVDGVRIDFVDLWQGAGPPELDQGVELGPSHALAPFDCGGTLGLFAVPRTNAAKALAPAFGLRSREGKLGPAGALQQVPRTSCVRIELALP